MSSGIQAQITKKKEVDGDFLADIIIDLTFATSYKIEELIKMPRPRLERLIERYRERFCKQ